MENTCTTTQNQTFISLCVHIDLVMSLFCYYFVENI